MSLLLESPLIRGGICALVLVAAFGIWLWRHDEKIEARATQQVIVKIEKANDNAANLGGGAAAGSLDVRVRGKRDPSTRDD